MEYYDYFDFSDEVNIAVKLYQDNEMELQSLTKQESDIGENKEKLVSQKQAMTNKNQITMEDQIQIRRLDRQIQDNLDELNEIKEKKDEINAKIKQAINSAKEKFEQKIQEKDDKLVTNETNIKVVKTQIDKCNSQIAEIKAKPDSELIPAIKNAMIDTLLEQKSGFEKTYDDFCKTSEKLVEEKQAIDKLNSKMSIFNMGKFIKDWKAINLPIMSVSTPTPATTPTTPVSTPTTPASTPTTPASTPTTPASTPTTPASTPTTPASTPTTPASTPTTPASTPTTPATTPTTPASTPTTPASTPTTPASTPTTPASTPTTPASTPTTPASTPTTPASTPTTPANTIQINIGRKIMFDYNDTKNKLHHTCVIPSKELQNVVGKLEASYKMEMIEDILEGKDGKGLDMDYLMQVNSIVDKLDDSIIYTLHEAQMNSLDASKLKAVKQVAMRAYIDSTIKNKPITGMNIEYDKKNLSTCHVRALPLVRKLTGEMNRKQKNYLNEKAEQSSEYTQSTGIYDKIPFRRYWKEHQQKKLPVKSVEYETSNLHKAFKEGYKMQEDPDKHKSQEQIDRENARAEQRRRAREEDNGLDL